jgi:hypothetical protein
MVPTMVSVSDAKSTNATSRWPLLRALRALREELGERVPRAHRDGRLGHLAHDVRDGAAHRGDGLAHDALEQRVLELLLARRRKRRPVRQDFALEDHRGELPHARVGVPARVAKERGDATPARIPDERLERRLRDASGLVLRGQQRAEDLGEVLQRRARRRSRRGGHLELSSRRHETLNSGRASDTPTRFQSARGRRRRSGGESVEARIKTRTKNDEISDRMKRAVSLSLPDTPARSPLHLEASTLPAEPRVRARPPVS